MMAMAQQESRELLTGLAQVANGRQTRTHEIADRLMSRIGNPDGGQFTRPMQLGQIDRIAPIRLDPISRLARDQRRSHDDAAMSGGLITEPKLAPGARQLRRQSVQGRRRFAILPYSRTSLRPPVSASATAIVPL